jgi:BASS family bile acid:Na+ symporter
MTLQQAIMLALQASILLTVLGFGLATTLDDVLYLARRPSLLVRSLLAMLVIMPLVALFIRVVFAFEPGVEIALVALALSPVPPLLPGKQQKAGGYAPYALGLMVIAGLLSVVTLPLSMELIGRYAGRPFAMAPGAVARLIVTSMILPIGIGLAVRAALPALAAGLVKPVGLVAKVLLAIGGLGLLAAAGPAMLELLGNGTLVVMAAFVAIGLTVGHLMGGPNEDHSVVLALSTASRHPAIAFAVAKANFPDEPNLLAAVLLYAIVAALVGIPYQMWRKRQAIV